MEFQKYINQNGSSLIQSEIKIFKNSQQKPRVIKFVGNMQENIKELINDINCDFNSKKQFSNILIVFANKIQKLRKQREHYKNTLKDYLLSMNKKPATELVQPKCQSVCKGFDNLNKQSQIPSLFKTIQKKIKLFQTLETQQQESLPLKSLQNYTAIKKPLYRQFSPVKHSKTGGDRHIKLFFQDQMVNDGEVEFSLNLSEFEDGEKQKPIPTHDNGFVQVPQLMNQTNLLESDPQQPEPSQSKLHCLKQLKNSSKFCYAAPLTQRKQSKLSRYNDKQNQWVKRYNITVQKLGQFIESKQMKVDRIKKDKKRQPLQQKKAINC